MNVLTYSQKYYRINKKRIGKYGKKRYIKIKNNPVYKNKVKKYSRKYWKKNKIHLTNHRKKYVRKYYQLNKETIDKINREYAINNRDKVRNIHRRYKAKHPEMILWGSLSTRCRLNKISLGFGKDYFYSWYLNIKKICEYCNISQEEWINSKDSLSKRMKKLQIDRVNPKLGYIKNNIVLACPRCNLTKSDYFDYYTMKKIGKLIHAAR